MEPYGGSISAVWLVYYGTYLFSPLTYFGEKIKACQKVTELGGRRSTGRNGYAHPVSTQTQTGLQWTANIDVSNYKIISDAATAAGEGRGLSDQASSTHHAVKRRSRQVLLTVPLGSWLTPFPPRLRVYMGRRSSRIGPQMLPNVHLGTF